MVFKSEEEEGYPAVFSGPRVEVLCRGGGGVVCDVFASESFADGGVGCHFIAIVNGDELVGVNWWGVSSDRQRARAIGRGRRSLGELSYRIAWKRMSRLKKLQYKYIESSNHLKG
jgi:hypothetical protein